MHTVRYETGFNGYRPFPPFAPPPPPPAPAPGVRTGLAALIALVSLFLVSSGVFVTLFLIAGGDHANTVARLEERQSQLAEVDGQLASAEAKRVRADERNTKLKSENAGMSGCVKAMQHYLWDGLADTQRTAAARDLLTKCR
ncbi:hypothetical protein DMH04_30950 [Kibdelosporangium aridum]|uniref:Uncharacterized protein n=1 Tax=Kibdelosporangium aridum TaxID=2030 RepID=A0A428Z2U6_KIBAR|nr:hypothetical protein [Kibdelosporangium aridum]RSM80017.1 hypothetical protein DMH04_30950 [Kibdelosporangium aridum]